MGRRLIIACVLAGALASAPSALAASETASSGDVTATFKFTGSAANYKHDRLTISRAGITVYDQPVVSNFCSQLCAPGSEGGSSTAVHVLDLEHNGSPDVVLDLYSGGAHCCSIEQFFSFDPAAGTYVKTERNFGDPGMKIVDLHHNGRFELQTADDSFAYEFTDYAASGLPVQVLKFSNRHFANVTRGYPKLIAKDAALWMGAFRGMAGQHYRDSVGVVAAWAADEDLLSHSKRVARFLARQAKAGHLNTPSGPAYSGKKFVAKLQRFLRAHGYLR